MSEAGRERDVDPGIRVFARVAGQDADDVALAVLRGTGRAFGGGRRQTADGRRQTADEGLSFRAKRGIAGIPVES